MVIPEGHSIALGRVAHVVRLCATDEMERVHTGRVVAAMTNDAAFNGADVATKGDTVRVRYRRRV